LRRTLVLIVISEQNAELCRRSKRWRTRVRRNKS